MRIECDTVILAVGEAVDMDFVRGSGLKMRENGTIEVDRFTLETSRSKFYAGGDVITGASNVSNAMGCGKKAARTMDLRLMGVARWDRISPHIEYSQAPPEPSGSHRHHVTEKPAAERVQDFEEAVVGLSSEQANEEASRCLRCDIRDVHH